MVKRKGQARLRVVMADGTEVDPRRYAQSALGHSSSQLTLPLDSRSISIARDSAQERKPYATLRICPTVVPQRLANDLRSGSGSDFKKDFKSMPDYHHAVTTKSTPNGEFTKWCCPLDNYSVENTDAEIRRTNLKRLIQTRYKGNKSAIARDHDPENPKPNYFSDLLRPGSGKSFAEKAARRIESAVGLMRGQLDIPNSPLLMDEAKRSRVRDELRAAIDDLDKDEQREALDSVREILARRNRRRRA